MLMGMRMSLATLASAVVVGGVAACSDAGENCEWAGCIDGCADLENGGAEPWGGCWSTCEEEPRYRSQPAYTCDTAVFLTPGETADRFDSFPCSYTAAHK